MAYPSHDAPNFGLVQRRLPGVLPRGAGGGQFCLAEEFHPNLPGAGSSAMGDIDSLAFTFPLLDDSSALPWANLECRRPCQCAGSEPADRAPLSRHPVRSLHGAATPALACQPQKALGQSSENLFARFRASPSIAGNPLGKGSARQCRG